MTADDATGAAAPVRVMLVDDQALVRLGLRMVLEAEPGIEVVGEAGDGARGVAMVRALDPDVVLMDVRMPVRDGVAATREVVDAGLRARVLVLTTFDLDEHAFAALRAGASGFLLKDVRGEELVAAVRAVAAGDAVVSPRVTRRLLELVDLPVAGDGGTGAGRALAPFTEREREVLAEVARGASNAEIARSLVLSEATVKGHVGRLLAKTGARDRVQVAVWAFRHGVVRPEDLPG